MDSRLTDTPVQYGQRFLLPPAGYVRRPLVRSRSSIANSIAGGVESHIYQLASKLADRGHKVIIITHQYDTRSGVRYLTNGLKVYYVPFFVIYRESTMPTVFSFFPIFRQIVLREKIQIVHGHASLSSLCHEAILHARTMGLR